MKLRERRVSRRDPRVYLVHIRDAIDILSVAARGKTADEYARDVVLRSAVERQFITIGEALVQLLHGMPELQARISSTREIIAFRNILVHGYADIAHTVVWAALQEDLPVLRREVDTLLRDMGDADT